MATVYSAYAAELDRKVAIKLMKLEPGGGLLESARARLLREAQAAARLSHPNVVSVYDAGAFGDELFMAMELVVGETLRSWLARPGRSLKEILAVFLAAGEGLAAAHAAGLVHRDFKPENVLIGPDSYVVEDFADFSTTREKMAGLVRDGLKMFGEVKPEYFIRNFAGIRAKRVDPATGEVLDFVCEAPEQVPGVINLVGIESPGLTGALPLARRACAFLDGREAPRPNAAFGPRLHGTDRLTGARFAEAGADERAAMIARDPDHGEIVCRCETVTKAEVLAAIRGPLGARTVDGVKMRTRATMGRCQGGYCQTRITELLARELGIEASAVLLGKKGSNLFIGSVRS
jgi:hypothetical protein